MKQRIRTFTLICFGFWAAGAMAPAGARGAEKDAAANDPRAAKMLALPSAGKFRLDELFRVRTGERFVVEFLQARKILTNCRVEVPDSRFIWTIDPTIVGAGGPQVRLVGYDPAAAHGTGVCEVQFTLRTMGVWIFVVHGDKSEIGCIELVEEKDKILFLVTRRKDGKVNGALFNPINAKNLGALRKDDEANKRFEQYLAPILSLFGLGMA